MFVGSLFAGWIKDYFTTGEGAQAAVDYTKVFIVPCALTVVCALVFFLSFKERKAVAQAA
jgi:hypothetical protein